MGIVREWSLARRAAPFLVLGAMLLGAVSISLLARWTGERYVDIDLNADAGAVHALAPAPDPRALRIAVASMLTPSSNVQAYRAVNSYIGSKLGRPVELVQRPTYGEVNDLLASGAIDAAFVCSGAFISLRRRGDARLLAIPVVGGETTYRSLIIVPSGSDATSFEELRRRTIAFVDTLSNTGYFYPLWRVRRCGSTLEEFFARTTFTNSHERSIWMVARGFVDAAAVDSLVYRSLLHRHPEIASKVRIVDRSSPFAIPPVVVSKTVDSDLEARLLEILLGLDEDPEGRLALEQLEIDRFTTGRDEDYDGIAEMLEEIGRGSAP